MASLKPVTIPLRLGSVMVTLTAPSIGDLLDVVIESPAAVVTIERTKGGCVAVIVKGKNYGTTGAMSGASLVSPEPVIVPEGDCEGLRHGEATCPWMFQDENERYCWKTTPERCIAARGRPSWCPLGTQAAIRWVPEVVG